jgi:hypothetical protein
MGHQQQVRQRPTRPGRFQGIRQHHRPAARLHSGLVHQQGRHPPADGPSVLHRPCRLDASFHYPRTSRPRLRPPHRSRWTPTTASGSSPATATPPCTPWTWTPTRPTTRNRSAPTPTCWSTTRAPHGWPSPPKAAMSTVLTEQDRHLPSSVGPPRRRRPRETRSRGAVGSAGPWRGGRRGRKTNQKAGHRPPRGRSHRCQASGRRPFPSCISFVVGDQGFDGRAAAFGPLGLRIHPTAGRAERDHTAVAVPGAADMVISGS